MLRQVCQTPIQNDASQQIAVAAAERPRGRAALCLARRSALAIPGARIIRSRLSRGALIPSPSAFRAQLSKLTARTRLVEQTATERARSVEARVRAETTSELAAVRAEIKDPN